MAKRSINIIKKTKARSIFSEIPSICLNESSMSTFNLRKQTVQTELCQVKDMMRAVLLSDVSMAQWE